MPFIVPECPYKQLRMIYNLFIEFLLLYISILTYLPTSLSLSLSLYTLSYLYNTGRQQVKDRIGIVRFPTSLSRR